MKAMGGYGRTGSRSPMQWDNTANAGFSAAPKEKLYIKQDDSKDRPTVESQAADKSSLYNEVKRLIALRSAHRALQSRGDIEFIYAEKSAYPLAYVRSAEGEKILVIINPSAQSADFSCALSPKKELYSLGGKISFNSGKITVPPQSAGFYLI